MAEETNSPEVTETQATETQTNPETATNPEETIQNVYNTDNPDNPETETEITYAGKFKTVSDLEKSYQELQSTFSKKLGAFEGAPEEYQTPEIDDFNSDDPIFNGLKEWGKENQLSQQGLENLYGSYAQIQKQQQEQQKKEIDQRIKQEMELLGPNASERLTNLQTFLDKNLDKESVETLSRSLTTAKSIEALEKLQKLSLQGVTGQSPQVQEKTYSKEQIEQMRFAVNDNGDRLMSVDPSYRAKVLKMEQSLLK